ncbi:hypothetical protein GCM10011491_27860 [Brucella endophytica]|uniref:Uncharacterized protein n=1 Tax=Brucella endophytica TaxID=1963359 RepID=A0A916SIK5_9HYPH|nr:hypothetical protein [Brucella endophytica]GGA98063.1 hypothetical protein GCM10011491_27860 [Brucella endophytica]
MSAVSIASFLTDFSPRRIPDERVVILSALREEEPEPEQLDEPSAEQAFEAAVDVELQVKQAFEAGREAGRAEADALYEAEKQRLQRAHEEEMTGIRASVLSETADRLTAQVETALQTLEASFSRQLADLIEPLIAAHIERAAVADFARQVTACLPAAMGMEIRGPRDLLDALHGLEGFASENFIPIEANAAELSLRLDNQVIETRLAPILAELKVLIR